MGKKFLSKGFERSKIMLVFGGAGLEKRMQDIIENRATGAQTQVSHNLLLSLLPNYHNCPILGNSFIGGLTALYIFWLKVPSQQNIPTSTHALYTAPTQVNYPFNLEIM